MEEEKEEELCLGFITDMTSDSLGKAETTRLVLRTENNEERKSSSGRKNKTRTSRNRPSQLLPESSSCGPGGTGRT